MEIDNTYDAYDGIRGNKLRELRKLVLEVAEKTDGVGQIEECLKWGQPSFVTVRPKSGSTVRIDAISDTDDKYAMYFICNTSLVDQFREIYPDTFEYQGNRAIIFDTNQPVPEEELRHCVAMALTYHLKR